MSQKTHTVRSGESLSIVARDVLGDVNRWPEIAYMNSITSPYIIQPGQTLVLPSDAPVDVTVNVAPVKKADSFSPVAVALLVAGAAFIWWMDKQ